MKKGILCFVLVFLGNTTFAAYQQQGFSEYKEKDNSISFSCTKECVIILGQKGGTNLVDISGVEGQGQIVVGVIGANNQIYPIKVIPTIENVSILVDSINGQKLPDQAPIVVLFQGSINMTNGKISLINAGWMTKLGQSWDEFWTFDSFRPYTINLLKGPMIGGKSANTIFLYICLLGFLYIIRRYNKTGNKVKGYMLIFALGVWVIYDIRMGSEMLSYYHHDYTHYVAPSVENKTYRDRGNFYRFVEFAQQALQDHGINSGDVISFKSDIPWPFPGSMTYFLYPYTIVYNYTGDAKATIVYQSSSFILSGDSSFLSGVIQHGTMKVLDSNSFIFFK